MPAIQSTSTKCPPRVQLQDYLRGLLDESLLASLEEHLSECSVCEQAAAQMESEPDTFVELLVGHPTAETVEEITSGRAGENSASSAFHVATTLPAEVGAYKLTGELGRGGMGSVFRARHQKLDKEVAIKLLPALPARQPEFVARFEREMRAAGKLEHPAIVRTTDAGEHNGVHYLVMDAIDGLDLSRIARVTRKLSIADACEVARQAALGLAHAHENGIVHRDIKPSNLMLDGDGTVRILDFGLAQIGLWENGTAEITTVGQLMGTLDYMAPEQAERGGAVDYRADLYSLGATLFRLLSGRPPLAAAPDLTPLEKLRLLSTHSAPKLSTLRPDTPPQLSKLVESLLARDPSARPASASHTAELLEPFCQPAELPSLLAAARKRESEEPAQASQLSLLPAKASVGNTSPPITSARALGWFAAPLLAFAAAAIWFTIETGKGQLVIESTDANVSVKLRKDGQVADELRIEPGTKTTRLWSGKYEIAIDSPSDSFSLSTDSFTIRRGETIVARITDKQAAAPDNVAQLAPAVDKRLDDIVYQGETLDTWLRKLKFERSNGEIERALLAVQALATPDLADLIVPELTQFLKINHLYDHTEKAVSAIRTAVGSKYFLTLQPVLDATTSNDKLTGFEYAILNQQDLSFQHASDFQPLVDWYIERLQATGSLDRIAALLGIDRGNTVRSDEFLSYLAEQLSALETATPGLMDKLDRDMWFGREEDSRSHWPDITRREALARMLRLIEDSSSDDDLRCKSLQLLQSCASNGFSLPEGLHKHTRSALEDLLVGLAADPEQAGLDWQELTTSQGRAHSKRTSTCVEALELIEAWDLQSEMKPTLERLHASLRELPLANSPKLRVNVAGFSSNESPRKSVCRTAFYLSGKLLDFPSEDLDLRLTTVLPSDRKANALKVLQMIDSTNQSVRYDGLRQAGNWLTSEDASEGTPLLVKDLAADADPRKTNVVEALTLLARVSDNSFSQHYIEILEASKDPLPLLNVDVSRVREIGGYDAEAADPLVVWAQKIFSGVETSEPIRAAAAKMLRAWLRDRGETIRAEKLEIDYQRTSQQMGYEFQKALIEGLEAIPELTDESFWLAEPACSDTDGGYPRMSEAFAEAMIRHAVKVIRSSDDHRLRCMALVCLRTTLRIAGRPDEDVLSQLTDTYEKQLLSFADQPSQLDAFHFLPDPMSPWCSTTSRRAKYGSACEAIQILDCISEFQLSGELSDALTKIYQTTFTARFESSDFSPQTTWLDDYRPSGSGQFAVEQVLIRSCKLLEKDFAELWRLPAVRRKEAVAKSQRTAEAGDTLAIYIEGLLPMEGLPLPVMQAGTNDPVVGYPVPVSPSGEIVIPYIKPIQVAGKELAEIRKLIAAACKAAVLHDPTTTVEMLSKSGEKQELRSLSSPASTTASER